MSVTVTGTARGEIEVKRLYIPGVVLSSPCPGCGESIEQDLGGNGYLSYPSVGSPEKLNFYHGDCPEPTSKYGDTEWSEWVQLDITISQAREPEEDAS